MMSVNIMDLNWLEIEALDKEKAVVMIGIAPIEQHGRHLPIGVDVYETEHWISLGTKKLEKVFPQYKFFTMPIIPLGYADIRGFSGNIYLSQSLIYQLTFEILEAIAKWGIKNIIIISGHADPKHLIAIEQACEKVNKSYGKIAFSPMGAIFSLDIFEEIAGKDTEIYAKTKEFPNDFHAGWIETSCMLSLDSSKVKASYKELPNIEVKANEMIFPEIIEQRIKEQGHLGYPKEASIILGDSLNEYAAQKITLCSKAFILRDNYEKYEHHELYKLPFLKIENGGGDKHV